MKIRQAFVANSSSSSFCIIRADKKTIARRGSYNDPSYTELYVLSRPIDEMIAALQLEKAAGATTFTVTYGTESDR
jgi:hypothetical protein